MRRDWKGWNGRGREWECGGSCPLGLVRVACLAGGLCAARGGYTILYSSTSTGYNLPGYGPPGRPSEVPPAVILKAELTGDRALRQSRNMKW